MNADHKMNCNYVDIKIINNEERDRERQRETKGQRKREIKKKYYLYIRDREDTLPASDPTLEPVVVDPSGQTQALTCDNSMSHKR